MNKECEMPMCVGGSLDDVHVVSDPQGEVLKMCDACLDCGWRGVVDILE